MALEVVKSKKQTAETEPTPMENNPFDRTVLGEDLQAEIADWEKQGWKFGKSEKGWTAKKQFPDERLTEIEETESLDVLFTEIEKEESYIPENFDEPETESEQEKADDYNGLDDEYQEYEPAGKKKALTRNVVVVLTDSEKLTRSEMLGKILQDLERTKREAKDVAADYKAKVKEIELDIYRLRETAVTGTEWRDVECFERPMYSQGIVEIVRRDTLEVADTRQMTDKERQKTLFW